MNIYLLKKLKTLITKLKANNQEIQISPKSNDNEMPVTIAISKYNNFLKMEISDYISITEFSKQTEKTDQLGITDLISTSVLWNSKRQKINSGTYYVILIDNKRYNILIRDNLLMIDERIYKEKITEERIIRLESNDYWYTIFHHDSIGNTFYTRYYNNSRFSLGNLDLTPEELKQEFEPVINNLKNIPGIENIIDINLLNDILLNAAQRGITNL